MMAHGKLQPNINTLPKQQQGKNYLPVKMDVNPDEDIPPWDVPPDEVYLDDPTIEWNQEENFHTTNKVILPEKIIVKPTQGKIVITQSLIKKLIDRFHVEKPFCPKFINEAYLTNTIKTVRTESMLKGAYFESLCLGGSTNGIVTDMTRKVLTKKKEAELRSKGLPLIGEKKIDQIRIETQAERFKLLAKKYQTNILPGINTHRRIYKHWNDKYILSGELDWFPTTIFYEDNMRLAIIDLKLGDPYLKTTEFCWGTPEYMDHIQADMYFYLIKDIDFDLNPGIKELLTPNLLDIIKYNEVVFLYWIWGIKEPLDDKQKLIERKYEERPGVSFRQKEMIQRIKETIAIIEREQQFGFPAVPCQESCTKCPHNQNFGGQCKESVIFKV